MSAKGEYPDATSMHSLCIESAERYPGEQLGLDRKKCATLKVKYLE